MAAVRASERVSIAWSGAAAIEDTDTLVLTIEGWSLDLRVFNSGPVKGMIDWSTVARVSTLSESTAENPQLRWDHLIDSRPPQPIDVPVLPDQGRFVPLANGDVEEHGTMYNPKTMTNQAYVETWRRLPYEKGQPYCVLQRDGMDEYMGRVGRVALGLAIDEAGFCAWRDEVKDGNWSRIFEHRARGRLPVDLPDWKAGQVVELDSQKWIVHVVGSQT